VKPFEKAVSLQTLKGIPELQNIGLIRIGRLSVMPLEQAEFNKILELGETSAP